VTVAAATDTGPATLGGVYGGRADRARPATEGQRGEPAPTREGIPVEVARGITAIDTRMAGRSLVTSAYLVRAEEPVLIETGPSTSAEAVRRGLGELGVGPGDLPHIVVTHIHLDHAGGAGTLARAFPAATIWVHERGAPHLADPTRLVASTARVYGEERMRALFGDVEPVPADRIRALADGDRLRLGGRALEVLHTPGHASHHLALQDDATGSVFVGDALGVHLPDVRVLRPATPPPEFDLELAVESVGRIRSRARGALLLSHFGPAEEVEALCDLAVHRMRAWAAEVRDALDRTEDLDEITRLLERLAADDLRTDLGEPPDPRLDLERYEILAGARINASGLVRYWRKRAEAQPS